MASITFSHTQRWYPGADAPAVPGVDLEIKDGEFMVLVGPSGCGKSTTLRTLAGLEEVPSTTSVRVPGRDPVVRATSSTSPPTPKHVLVLSEETGLRIGD